MTTKEKILAGDMKKDVPFITFVEQPIEDMILNFCHFKASYWKTTGLLHKGFWSWFTNDSYSRECRTMASAYETVAEKIIELKKDRASISKVKRGLKDEI